MDLFFKKIFEEKLSTPNLILYDCSFTFTKTLSGMALHQQSTNDLQVPILRIYNPTH